MKGFKGLGFGSIDRFIAESDIDPTDKAKLLSRQSWIKFISWFLQVILLGSIGVYINYSYDNRELKMAEKKNSFELNMRRFAYSDSLNAIYLDQYLELKPIQRYRFLNHMRFTAPDARIRSNYEELFEDFFKLEGDLVRDEIQSHYQKKAENLGSEIEQSSALYEKLSKKQNPEDQRLAKQTEEKIRNLRQEKDRFEQLAENVVYDLQHQGIDINSDGTKKSTLRIDETFSLKQAYNANYFVKRFADGNLEIGLIRSEPDDEQQAIIFIRTGGFKNPTFYEEAEINLEESFTCKIESANIDDIPQSLQHGEVTLKLEDTWRSGVRNWAELSIELNPR